MSEDMIWALYWKSFSELHYGGYSDSPNLDFNVILQGDLNFWMLDNTQGVHSDEGCFLFTQSHFSENIPKLVKT